MSRLAKRHFFDGEPGVEPCRACGEPYEGTRFDHDFGKLINPLTGVIRPFTAEDEVRERAELAAQDAAMARAQERLAELRAFPIGSQARYDGRLWTVTDYLLEPAPRLILVAAPPFEGPARISASPSSASLV